MDLWDIFTSSNATTTISSNDTADVCQLCNVAFEYIEGGKLCPMCNQIQDFSFIDTSNTAPTTVIIRDGHLQTRTQTYNRSKILLNSYQQIFVNSKFRPSPEMMKQAVSLINAAQKFTSNNRGRNLNDMMAGAMSISATMFKHAINETQIARIFKTPFGTSRGRNMVMTACVKGQLLGLDKDGQTKDLCFTESNKTISNLIRKSMRDVDLNPDDRNMYMFIKSLVFIDRLYRYIDQQIMNTKISASIYYYFTFVRNIARPLTIKDVAAKLEISPESIRKYFEKLKYAGPAIRLIGEKLNVGVDVPQEPKK